jgi:hypothetical protein
MFLNSPIKSGQTFFSPFSTSIFLDDLYGIPNGAKMVRR